MKPKSINFRFMALMVALAAALFAVAWQRIDIEMDIVESLPTGHPAISDAAEIFRHHPIQDQITIDIGLARPDPDRLVVLARQVESRLGKSGLFTEVGMEKIQQRIPRLATSALDRLPDLFPPGTWKNRSGRGWPLRPYGPGLKPFGKSFSPWMASAWPPSFPGTPWA